MVTVRPALPDDTAEMAALLEQLGYRMTESDLRRRLAALADSATDAARVAVVDGRVAGLVALHWSTMLHDTAPKARITTLVVDDRARGTGVGRRLVEAGAELARQAGCTTLELTTAMHRKDAQAFYEAIGFTASSIRLHRPL